MKKNQRVLREILYRTYERGERFMSQTALARECKVSLDLVNQVAARLHGFGAIEKKPMGFRVTNPRKILLYWASTRNLRKDIVYSTYSPDSASEIEAQMPRDAIFTCFSGYRLRFGEVPAHYERVFVYADASEVRQRFPKIEAERMHIFVLRPDPNLARVSEGGAAPLVQIYVDLWQTGGAIADRFIIELEKKFEALTAEALKTLLQTDYV